MELFAALVGGVVIVALALAALAVWRIGRVASWRALAMTARATGSLTECVAFIRFCAQERDELGVPRPLDRRRPAPRRTGTLAFEEMRRAS